MTKSEILNPKQIPNSKFKIPKLGIGYLVLVIIWLLVIGYWLFAFAEEIPKVATVEAVVVTPEVVATPEGFRFKDVEEAHWASKAVYDLLKLGVTQGYPDGTFRGGKNITRYESAVFLSKLAASIAPNIKMLKEKTKKDLEKELEEVKSEFAEAKKPPPSKPEFGNFEVRYRFGNLTSHAATPGITGEVIHKLDYRIRASFKKEINKSANIKASIDTMDAGLGSGSQDFARKILDVEGNISTSILKIKITSGPSTVIHTDTQFPSDDGIAFLRPSNSITVLTNLWDTDFSANYTSSNPNNYGDTDINYVGLTLDKKFKGLLLSKVSGTIDHSFLASPRELPSYSTIKEYIEVVFIPLPQIEITTSFGAANVLEAHDNIYGGLALSVKGYPREGTDLDVKFHKVGKKFLNYPVYLAEEDYFGGNFFDHLIYNPYGHGITDLGVSVGTKTGEYSSLSGKGEIALTADGYYGEGYPGTYGIAEIESSWALRNYGSFSIFYRVYHNPTTLGTTASDALGLKFMSQF